MGKIKGKKPMLKGPVGGPAGVAAMCEHCEADAATPRSSKTTRLSSDGMKKKMGR